MFIKHLFSFVSPHKSPITEQLLTIIQQGSFHHLTNN